MLHCTGRIKWVKHRRENRNSQTREVKEIDQQQPEYEIEKKDVLAWRRSIETRRRDPRQVKGGGVGRLAGLHRAGDVFHA